MTEYVCEIVQDFPDVPYESDGFGGEMERRERVVDDGAIPTEDRARSLWNRRAERTCRNLNPPSCRDFECSECLESSEFTPGFMPNYCPHCGAKVVDDD